MTPSRPARCRFSADARADLLEIADFIAQDSPARALSFVRELRARCVALAAMPYSGQPRPDLQPELRSRPAGAYVIFYQPAAGGIEVVRVLHGNRDVPAQF